ncbi:tumor necrosis factor receptor superfamily member 27 [Heterodontus francisci]|uniref:tumor necrosis factor receptor superfamily member 27 n=1 Tax=Heterodontus francisci TaxID=7792 RepID=UPI00355AF451
MEPRLELLVFFSLPLGIFTNLRDCRENEFWDVDGNCKFCKECGPGMELSKDCGFGVGAGAQCVICRPNRYKDSWGQQKCKLCLSCVLVNRVQEKNCTVSSNAECGQCFPGFYRKTRLGGLQDTECIPCTDPAPPTEPQCISRTNVVRVLSSGAPPYDTALVAVVCSALTTVLLAALLLCFIYCRQLITEKQNNGHLRPPVAERARVESSSSEGQLDGTEGLIKHCQTTSADKNAAQPAGPADVVQPEDAACTLRSCFVAYLCPSGSQCQGRSIVTCPAFSSSLPQNYCQGGTPELQPLTHKAGYSDCSGNCPPVKTSSCGIGDEHLPGCDECASVPSGEGACETSVMHCASLSHDRRQHAPVECTELDLQEYLTDVRCECTVVAQETAAVSQPSRPHEEQTTASCSFGPCPCIKGPCMWDDGESRAEECSSSGYGNSQHCNLPTGNNRVADLENLLNQACELTQGEHI